jgi:hypothetical protein
VEYWSDYLPAVNRVAFPRTDDAQKTIVRRFVDRVGAQYGVRSVLEGPVDGTSGQGGAYSALLSARGVAVTVAVSTVDEEAAVRIEYSGMALDVPEIRCIPDPLAKGALPQADMVVSFDAPPSIPAWPEYVAVLARAARKVLIVLVRNPDRVLSGASHPGRQTRGLAHVLWSVGRVREHVYLDVPSWVTALYRARRRPLQEGIDSLAGAPVVLTAALHAFVLDTAPRTPQARRRLGLAVSN